MFPLYSLTFLAICTSSTLAGSITGYTYDKPTVPSTGLTYQKSTVPTNEYAYQKPQPFSLQNTGTSAGSGVGAGGHYFPSLPTVKPLPAVPSLPPLPTPRSKGIVHQQALFQTHPAPTSHPITTTYNPTSTQHSTVGRIAQQYRPLSASSAAINPTSITTYGSFPSQPDATPIGSLVPPTIPSSSGNHDTLFGSFGPSAPISASGPSAPAEAQPLRIPFGKSAVIHFPEQAAETQDIYSTGNERPLKQYAVIEIIDNDIVQNNKPFLPAPVRNEYRAQFGATGTGASAAGGFQLSARASSNVLEQQRLATQGATDSIALGSGGLGFIRLSNGNVYLGSGSLGYISGQQLSQNVNEARTRSEQAQPGALHFGHGSLGGGKPSFNRIFDFH